MASLVAWEIRASGSWGTLEMTLAEANRDLAYRMAFGIVQRIGGLRVGKWEIRPAGGEWEDVS